jgi:hypothetical protein
MSTATWQDKEDFVLYENSSRRFPVGSKRFTIQSLCLLEQYKNHLREFSAYPNKCANLGFFPNDGFTRLSKGLQ